MAIASKTWVFAADAENLAQQVGGGTAPTFAFQGTDGNTAGSVEFAQGTKSQTNAVCEAYNATTGATFASHFGIATDASVSAVRITRLDDRVAANTKLSSHSLSVQLIDDAGSVIATLGTINPGTATGGWVDVGAQTSQNITKSGSDGCRLKLVYTCTTSGGGGGANVVYRIDNIAVEVTYTAPTNITVTPGTASLTTARFTPTVTASDHKTAVPGVVALSTNVFAPTVSATDHKTATPSTASLVLTAFAPTVTADSSVTVTPGVANLVTTRFEPTVTVTQHQTVTPSTAALTLTRFAPTVTAGSGVTVTPGTLALTTTRFTPTVSITQHQTITPGVGSLTLTGFAPTVTTPSGAVVTPGVATLILTPFIPRVLKDADDTSGGPVVIVRRQHGGAIL